MGALLPLRLAHRPINAHGKLKGINVRCRLGMDGVAALLYLARNFGGIKRHLYNFGFRISDLG